MILLKEEEMLIEIIENSLHLQKIVLALYGFKAEHCYIGAGAISQTVWNILTNRPVDYGIDDIDIVYYNSQNIEEKYEKKIAEYLNQTLEEYPLWLDVKNEARVHLWYKEKFGYDIEPYKSIEEAIDTWPTTATSLGVRKISENCWEIYAPFGLKDIFEMKVVANNRQITKEIYNTKVKKWVQKWPELNIVKWDNKSIPFVDDKKIYVRR
ncbi:nucleotidyltransferase family protein [Proteiniborus sp. MB09-C3]|uniref:nucleotidyltransferase family protein n=1 Tax=Proteiniborus sp. MB09-C3 TaxID=3050072 RepID=UPI002552595A|nr:nucleotidyltransferase family protein [Proteiniborus sp. MB09-C3]WIV12706.1 nucleotidyltransferase family protein [Proteiniborus sp. MB09-C3]